MHNIVLHISIYLFPLLHILCDLKSIKNDRKLAFSAIFIYVFVGALFFNGGLPKYMYLCTQSINKNGIVCLGCQYTDPTPT